MLFWRFPASFKPTRLCGTCLVLLLGAALRLSAQGMAIYTDALQNNWVNYSWATVSFTATSPVHSGSDSISVSCTNYQAIYLHHNNAFDSTPYSNITFWIYVTTSAPQTLTVRAPSTELSTLLLHPPIAHGEQLDPNHGSAFVHRRGE